MASRIVPVGTLAKPGARIQRVHRVVDEAHLKFLRTLPCVASGQAYGIIAHHLTIGRGRMGRKAGDDLALPLNTVLHEGHRNSLHSVGEKNFWNALGMDPFPLAAFLYANTGDYGRCAVEIKAFRAAATVYRAAGVKFFDTKDTA